MSEETVVILLRVFVLAVGGFFVILAIRAAKQAD